MRFLQINIKSFFKMILSYWVCVVKYTQITKNSNFRGTQFSCYHKMTNDPSSTLTCTCLILVPSHPCCKHSKLYVNPPRPPPITKIVNGVIFILCHKHWLESALLNARKNILLIWKFPMFPWIQIQNHQLQKHF